VISFCKFGKIADRIDAFSLVPFPKRDEDPMSHRNWDSVEAADKTLFFLCRFEAFWIRKYLLAIHAG